MCISLTLVLSNHTDSIAVVTGSTCWLGGRDSNPDSQIQSLESYHWTTSQQRSRIYGSQPEIVNRDSFRMSPVNFQRHLLMKQRICADKIEKSLALKLRSKHNTREWRCLRSALLSSLQYGFSSYPGLRQNE